MGSLRQALDQQGMLARWLLLLGEIAVYSFIILLLSAYI